MTYLLTYLLRSLQSVLQSLKTAKIGAILLLLYCNETVVERYSSRGMTPAYLAADCQLMMMMMMKTN